MDPTKPKPTALTGQVASTATNNTLAKVPKKSFESTMNARTKSPEKSNTPAAKNPVLAAIEQSVDPEAESKKEAAEEALRMQLIRSVLSAPKAQRIQIDRAEDPNNEE